MTRSRSPDLRIAGVTVVTSAALLLVALFFDWWGLPPAFEHPDDLPDDVGFLAESLRDVPDQTENSFRFFEVRDLLWLVMGVCGFAAGLVMLTATRAPLVIPVGAAVLGLVGGGVLAATLISPPDYADLAPSGGPPVDFGIELPLAREAGGVVALAAMLGMVLGSTAAAAQLRSARGGGTTT